MEVYDSIKDFIKNLLQLANCQTKPFSFFSLWNKILFVHTFTHINKYERNYLSFNYSFHYLTAHN